MKYFIYSVALFSTICLTSCDKIKNPIESKNTAVGTSFVEHSNALTYNYRKVLLEDYTGHTCGNCPAAADVATSLHSRYKDSVVIVAVHAGYFSAVKLPSYPASYTTTAGKDWDATFIGNAGNPNGMVNRKSYAGSGVVQKETKWQASVGLAIKEPLLLTLRVTTKYDTLVRALNTEVRAKFKSSYPNSVKISAIFIEDGITGAQTDYRKSPDLIENYIFNHMLRGSFNGSWGDPLRNSPIQANDSNIVSFNNVAIDAALNDKKVSVVIFAYDATSKEILQVERVGINSTSGD